MFENVNVLTLGIVFGSIIVSMTLHEAMHAFTGLWLGDDTAQREGRITLNPIKHIDIFTTVLLPLLLIISGLPPFFAAKPVPFNPSRVRYEEFGAALVGIVGPLTNLLLAFAAAGFLHLTGGYNGSLMSDVLTIFIIVNVAFFVFNMIPFPPLDGSRLLYAFAPTPIQNFIARIEQMGFMAIVVFMLLFFSFLAPVVIDINKNIVNFLI